MNMMRISRLLVFALASLSVIPAVLAQPGFDHEYTNLALVLSSSVNEQGMVDYQSLKKNPEQLPRCLSDMSQVDASDYRAWSKDQQLAFLINLYNTHTIGLIARHYPVKSIKDIGSLWQGPWGQPVVSLFGRRTSLDFLSNKLMYPQFKDPRIRFALCFGAISSPGLRSEPFRANMLDRQLEDQVFRFFRDPRNLDVMTDGSVVLSELIKWNAGEFGKNDAARKLFIARYAPDSLREKIEAASAGWSYRKFNWSLNQAGR